MDLDFTDELRDFQQEVRAFIEERLPADLRTKVERFLTLGKDDYLRWQGILAEKGWLVYSWPKSSTAGRAGRRRSATSSRRKWGAPRAPRIIPFGPKMVGPVIYTFGTDAQKAKYLPAIASERDVVVSGLLGAGRGLRSREPAHPRGP